MSSAMELAMRRKVESCLKSAALILENHKVTHLACADQVPHRYEDKYLLSDQLVNMTISCTINAMKLLGVSDEKLSLFKSWSMQRAVSLSFTTETKCVFVKETERDVEDPTRVQVDGVMGMFVGAIRVITKVKEYVYAVEKSYQLRAFTGVGANAAESIVLLERTYKTEITTGSRSPPYGECVTDKHDVNITWLLQQLDESAQATRFAIDRTKPTCFTPRQNADTNAALQFFKEVGVLFGAMERCMVWYHDFQTRHSTVPTPQLSDFNSDGVFNPVAPMFEGGQVPAAQETSVLNSTEAADALVVAATELSRPAPVVLPPLTVNALIAEQKRSLDAKCAQVETMCASSVHKCFTAVEAKAQVALSHIYDVSACLSAALQFIEQMIRSQLVAAIGKEVSARDFSQYMTFHNRKVFRETYQPRPFSFAVRRSPVHSPEGQVQIVTDATTPAEPIFTVSHTTEGAPLMEFALNATTTVKFGGERHVHGWMAHRFSGQALPSLKLVTQARQFSSYMVLIGRIASAKLFQPKYAFIVQNKDELTIPLELEQIPTAKEFKDAISSLSPEQQRFAKAYRSMQLESTLFAVCVIQIKPQLEKVLKLQADSLTKEIKLTQDLMQLFIKYQIPTDLLSFDPQAQQQHPADQGGEASAAERLLAVKRHVQAMQEMLLSAKEEEVAQKQQLDEYKYGEIKAHIALLSDRSEQLDVVTERSECLELSAVQFNKNSSLMKKGGGLFFGSGGGGGSAVHKKSVSSVRSLNVAPGSAPASSVMRKSEGRPAGSEVNQLLSAKLDRKESSTVRNKLLISGDSAPVPAAVASSKALPNLSAGSAVNQGSADRRDQQLPAPEDIRPSSEQVDYTKYPTLLEEAYTKYDPDSSLRPTIINPGATWEKRAQAGLLAAPTTQSLGAQEQSKEKDAAFDLLDALTRSGALVIEHASLHIVVAATHCFDQSVMDTLVQRSVNPIERVERSTLIMAATLHGQPAAALVQENQVERLQTYSPAVLLENALQDQR